MARGIASVKVKEFETYLKKPPDFLSQREEAKIWEELKGCVTNNKGRVDDAFAKFEVAIKTKYQSYRLETRREYKELKKSIIDASRTKKSAEALEISGQAPRNSPSPSSNLPKEVTELEKHLKQPTDMLSSTDAKKLWNDLKECVLTSDEVQVERAFGKLEQNSKCKIEEKKKNYSRLKDSIIATCKVKKVDVDTDKLAPTQEITGKYRNIIQVQGDVQTKASKTDEERSAPIVLDRICHLIKWFDGVVTNKYGVSPPGKSIPLDPVDTVMYNEVETLIFNAKDVIDKWKSPRQQDPQQIQNRQQMLDRQQKVQQHQQKDTQSDHQQYKNRQQQPDRQHHQNRQPQPDRQQYQNRQQQPDRQQYQNRQQQMIHPNLDAASCQADDTPISNEAALSGHDSLTNDKPIRIDQKKYEEIIHNQRQNFEANQQKLNEELQALRVEKDQLMTRLSKMAGDKLTHNNAGIADLSDPNRPQKLAEQYGELYDNEWTDAMEIFNPKKDEKVEQQSIRVLADILKNCYDESEQMANQQLSKMWAECFNLTPQGRQKKPNEMNETAKRHLLDAQYSASVVTMEDAVRHVTVTGKLKDKAKKIPKYTEKCIRICWSMVTHTPRMIFLWPDSKDRKIDMNMFQFYTKSGDTLDFVVWPAMLSHRDGPLLRKGTVQPVPVSK